MTRWEIKRLVVPLSVGVEEQRSGDRWLRSAGGAKSKDAWAKAEALASEGWELVGTVGLISGHEMLGDIGSQYPFGYGSSYTEGYVLLFKRPIASPTDSKAEG